ncbi:hypothetical protein BGZ47_007558 [Haplosporangium gracile]|nr:hypothetical protein BGZ47_007558 [Haplosporangium gracile]
MTLVLSTMAVLPTTTSADVMVLLQPACSNLSNIDTIKKFADSKLTPRYRKCYCSLPAGNAWYQTCLMTNKCNAEMMGLAAKCVKILRTKTVCIAKAGSGSGSGSGSSGASDNATVNVLASGDLSGKAVASSVGVVTAPAAVFATLL